MQYFYDGFYKSRSFSTWERHRDREIEKAERQRLEKERVKTRRRRQRVAVSRKVKEPGGGTPKSLEQKGAKHQEKQVKLKRVRKKPLSILAAERELKTLARKDKPWCNPECEFMPARISEIEAYNSSSDEDSEVYCVCNGGNAGTMVMCSECSNWYHASCVGLRKDMLSEYSVFRCEKCAVYAVGIHRGPELERPATWVIKAQRGESTWIDIIALKPLKVKGPWLRLEDINTPAKSTTAPKVKSSSAKSSTETVIRLQKGDFGRILSVPRKKHYVLLLGHRSVALWDREHKRLIAGSAAPTVSSLNTYLLNNPLKKPWHGSIRRNNAASSVPVKVSEPKPVTSSPIKTPAQTLQPTQQVRNAEKATPQRIETKVQTKLNKLEPAPIAVAAQTAPKTSPTTPAPVQLEDGLEVKRKQKILEKERLMLLERNQAKAKDKRKDRKRPASQDSKPQRKKEKIRKKQTAASQSSAPVPAIVGQHMPPSHMVPTPGAHLGGHPPYYPGMGGTPEEQYNMYLRHQHSNHMRHARSMLEDPRQVGSGSLGLGAARDPRQVGPGIPNSLRNAEEDEVDLTVEEMRTRLEGQYHAQRLQLQYTHQQQMQQLQYQQHHQLQHAYTPTAQMQLRVVHRQEQQMLAASHQQQIIRFDQELQHQVHAMMEEQKINREKRNKRKEKEREIRNMAQDALRQQEEQRRLVMQRQLMQQHAYQQQMMMHPESPQGAHGMPVSDPSRPLQSIAPSGRAQASYPMYEHLGRPMMPAGRFPGAPFGLPPTMATGGRPMPGTMHPVPRGPLGSQHLSMQDPAAKAPKYYGARPPAAKPKKMVACEYPGCTKTYTQRHNLLTHMRKKHGYQDDASGSGSKRG